MSDIPHSEIDNSSFVEHLRLIHFTLLATCLVAMVAITSTSPSLIGLAHEEVKQLLTLRQIWQDGQWLQSIIATKKETINPVPPGWTFRNQKTLIYAPDPNIPNNVFLFPQPGRRLPTPDPREHGGTSDWFMLATKLGGDGVVVNPYRSPFKTVADAQLVWNALQSNGVIFKVARDGWYVDDSGKSRELRFQSIGNVPPEGPIRARGMGMYLRSDLLNFLTDKDWKSTATETLASNIRRDGGACYLAPLTPPDRRPGYVTYVLRADCESEQLLLQAQFVKDLPPPRPAPGQFSSSFANLSEVAKHLTGLTLDDLQIFVEAERKRSGEKIELLGAKLPLDTVAIWGIGLLLVVAGYFWAIFRDFANRATSNDVAWNVPWIGISTEIVSRVVFYITLLVPICTTIYLAYRGIQAEKLLFLQVVLGTAPVGMIALVYGIVLTRLKILRLRANRLALANPGG